MHQGDVLALLCLLLHVLVRRKAHFLTNILEVGLEKGEICFQPLLLPCDGDISSEKFSAVPHQFYQLTSVKASDLLTVLQPATHLPLKPRLSVVAFSLRSQGFN